MRLCFVLSFVILMDYGTCKYFQNNQAINRKSLETSSREYHKRRHNHLSIPIMIHFDDTLTYRLTNEHKLKTRKELKNIAKHIIKEAKTIFTHPSLNSSISLELYKTRFLRKNTIRKDENASKFLGSFCNWQREVKMKTKRWWFSILLTELDVFYVNSMGAKVRNGTGRSYVGGMCAISKSCALIEWKSNNMGYLIAHEIGHSLGMSHDGPPQNRCKPYVNIMSSKYHPLYQPRSWSACSKRSLQRFLISRKGWCLREDRGNSLN